MSIDIQNLIAGYKQFRCKYFTGGNNLYKILVKEGQTPRFLMVACSDSRVDPALVLNCKPGDLFVVRNVANLIPPYENDSGYHGTSAALEFGINGLGIKDIIVFGHSSCGGIKALVEKYQSQKMPFSFVAKWMEIAKPAAEAAVEGHPELNQDEKIDYCAQYGLLNSLRNLHSFPWIKEKVDAGELSIHLWYFEMNMGKIFSYDLVEQRFVELEMAENEF